MVPSLCVSQAGREGPEHQPSSPPDALLRRRWLFCGVVVVMVWSERPANEGCVACINCCLFASSRQSQGLPGRRTNYKAKSKRCPAPPPSHMSPLIPEETGWGSRTPWVAARPANHSHTIEWVSHYTLVCWGRFPGHRGRPGGRPASIACRAARARCLNRSPRVLGGRRGLVRVPHPALGRGSLTPLV